MGAVQHKDHESKSQIPMSRTSKHSSCRQLDISISIENKSALRERTTSEYLLVKAFLLCACRAAVSTPSVLLLYNEKK
uniref:Uncharacterized protein n=1 Tax=Arundo donax TaxID=35708 RepID=A0A0A9GV62_ARUDO